MEFLLVATTMTNGKRIFTQTFNKEEDSGLSALGINDDNQELVWDARMCLGD